MTKLPPPRIAAAAPGDAAALTGVTGVCGKVPACGVIDGVVIRSFADIVIAAVGALLEGSSRVVGGTRGYVRPFQR